MRETWRWFGPIDKVTLGDVAQAGASGIVTALYDLPPGTVWSHDAVARRAAEIAASPAPLTWDVVESLSVSEEIKTGGSDREAHIDAWIDSLPAIAAAGPKVICYNFMPILDWTRTDLHAARPSGAKALRFDLTEFAAFDIHILKRPGAEADYAPDTATAAGVWAQTLDGAARDHLTRTILAGLPGTVQGYDLASLRARLATYDEIDAEALRANFHNFLTRVVPVAEDLGLRLCCHPDDPPWPLLGLPRIMSTEADYHWLVNAVPSPANGITFCTGSLGAHPDNDLPGMVERLGPHIHFLHLRNVRRENGTVPGSFFEDDHLAGSTDMIAVIAAILAEEHRRAAEGRNDSVIPMRPDHGQELLDDHHRRAAPGYPAIGRLKGLAELRGAAAALSHTA